MDSSETKRVWIANYAGHDYTEAEKYGELRYITRGYVSFGSLDRLKWMVADSLKEANGEDWLLLSGAISINIIATIVLFVRFGRVNLLAFDKKTDKYSELLVSESNLVKLLEVVHDGQDYKEKGGA